MSFADQLRNVRALSAPEQAAAARELIAQSPVLKDVLRPPIERRIEAYTTVDDEVRQMLRNARLCAFRPEPVLITGPSGTGKELIARIMLGARMDDAFKPVNCAGIVETLFESAIFGHKAGAFTGANVDRPGLLVSAGTGVAFFDEIGELPMTQQAKLLRALQEQRVLPVGGTLEVPIRCRFVFATNRNLIREVDEGRFREDLYYRISALTLQTTAIRDRPHDAAPIMYEFCKKNDYTPPEPSIPDSVIQSRGNVRAIQNWVIAHNVLEQK